MDASFNPPQPKGWVWASVVQPDGKIIIVGDFTQVAGVKRVAVARLLSNGDLDTSFSGDGIATIAVGTEADYAYTVVEQPDGKLLICGYSDDSASAITRKAAIVRLNSDGSLDTSFDGDGKSLVSPNRNVTASAMSVQKDGKLVLAGTTSFEVREVLDDVTRPLADSEPAAPGQDVGKATLMAMKPYNPPQPKEE